MRHRLVRRRRHAAFRQRHAVRAAGLRGGGADRYARPDGAHARLARLLQHASLSAAQTARRGGRDLSGAAREGWARRAGAAQRPAPRRRDHLRVSAHDAARPLRGRAAGGAPHRRAGQRREGEVSLHDVARPAHAADDGAWARRAADGERLRSADAGAARCDGAHSGSGRGADADDRRHPVVRPPRIGEGGDASAAGAGRRSHRPRGGAGAAALRGGGAGLRERRLRCDGRGRSRPAAADPAQPADERDQVHAARRTGLGFVRAQWRTGAAARARHRHRHRARADRQHLRSVRATGRAVERHRPARRRPGPRHQPRSRPRHGGRDHGDEHPRRGLGRLPIRWCILRSATACTGRRCWRSCRILRRSAAPACGTAPTPLSATCARAGRGRRCRRGRV